LHSAIRGTIVYDRMSNKNILTQSSHQLRIVSAIAATKNVEGGAAVLLKLRILVGRLRENIFIRHSVIY